MQRNWRSSVTRNALTLCYILIAGLTASACHSLSSPSTPRIQITKGVNPGGSCRIAGTVTTEGNALPGATVSLLSSGTPHTAVTDVNGRFIFPSVPAGEYTVRYELSGLSPRTQRLTLRAGDAAVADADLKLSSVSEAITVTAAAPAQGMNPGVFTPPAMNGSAPPRRVKREPATVINSTAVLTSLASTLVPMQAEATSGEEYAFVPDNQFQRVAEQPLSTFSIDVDRASYANVRRFLNGGMLPPPNAVRIEELINYFSYSYPDSTDGAPFGIFTEIADCPWSVRHRLLHIGLQAKRIDTAALPPSNLVFLLDVSGSMASPDKLPLIQAALHLLVDQLRKEDRVAIVVYAGAAGLVLPSTPGDQKSLILSAIDALQPEGSTAGGEGINLAYKIAADNFQTKGNNRVILATDGDFNVGVSSIADLQTLIEEKRKSKVFLSVLGVGTGNLRDALMETLADKGNGNYAYLDSIDEARKVLVQEIGGTLVTVARNVKLQIAFNPAVVAEYRLVGYENRMLKKEDFHDDTKDAGELGAGHSVTALYELVPPGAETLPATIDTHGDALVSGAWPVEKEKAAATLSVRYMERDSDSSKLLSRDIQDSNASAFAASDSFRFAAAVAEWGMLLRGSADRSAASYVEVLRLGRSALNGDSSGYRAEFVKLVEHSDKLARTVVSASK
ncbi:MAG TPA: von Willebrand factor type A domain-containing protein [Thermoanaerobaculia bacterium]|nr:von Willebrand factor type A domain-containing protein [Thermoanaerobaculia bacterium]